MAEHRPAPVEEHGAHSDPDHDIHVPMLWKVAIGLTVGTILAGALMVGLFLFEKKLLDSKDPAPAPMAEARAPRVQAGPLLQKDPTADMNAYRAAESKILEGYGWTDKAAGVARVPVKRAQEIVLAQGVAPLCPPPAEEAR